mmetsp:Transcript_3990/g.16248  ORF Transcript_3990/g.16248 Transcript_3990/m.16248 type:complete len:528 (-) Transcript_3990:2941-4524(-)
MLLRLPPRRPHRAVPRREARQRRPEAHHRVGPRVRVQGAHLRVHVERAEHPRRRGPEPAHAPRHQERDVRGLAVDPGRADRVAHVRAEGRRQGRVPLLPRVPKVRNGFAVQDGGLVHHAQHVAGVQPGGGQRDRSHGDAEEGDQGSTAGRDQGGVRRDVREPVGAGGLVVGRIPGQREHRPGPDAALRLDPRRLEVHVAHVQRVRRDPGADVRRRRRRARVEGNGQGPRGRRTSRSRRETAEARRRQPRRQRADGERAGGADVLVVDQVVQRGGERVDGEDTVPRRRAASEGVEFRVGLVGLGGDGGGGVRRERREPVRATQGRERPVPTRLGTERVGRRGAGRVPRRVRAVAGERRPRRQPARRRDTRRARQSQRHARGVEPRPERTDRDLTRVLRVSRAVADAGSVAESHRRRDPAVVDDRHARAVLPRFVAQRTRRRASRDGPVDDAASTRVPGPQQAARLVRRATDADVRRAEVRDARARFLRRRDDVRVIRQLFLRSVTGSAAIAVHAPEDGEGVGAGASRG